MDDLGRTIADLVERKRAALVDSAEWCLANNALIALRYSITGAGDIIDDLDHCAETLSASCCCIALDRAPIDNPAVPYSNNSEAAAGLRGIEGAGAAQARSSPAGSGAADRGWPPRNEVGAEGAAEAARRLEAWGE